MKHLRHPPQHRRRRLDVPSRWPWRLAGALLLIVATIGVAYSDPILHEFFILPADEASQGGGGAADGERPRDGALGALSDALNEPSTAPPLTIENRGEEMEVGADGQLRNPDGSAAAQHNGPFDNEALAKPDRDTRLDESLNYFTVFNPSVVPWKRVSARDEVHSDYSMGVRYKQIYALKVQDRPVRAGHERFWGSLLVHLRKGQQMPLPSVAPRAEILRYQTEPPTRLEFHRDMADNFYVSGNYDGTVRLNYLMEVHESYFGGDIDAGLQVSDLPRSLRPSLPPRVQAAADRAIDEIIGVDRGAPLREQLDTLVAYFRSFEAEDFPQNERSQDIYLDLVSTKLGVCRHRSFAFVVTAHGLGILARYVHNEAHAFVEVMIPRRGWLRIDLGGAAVDFSIQNSDDKVLHEPEVDDGFTQPEGFTNSYSNQLAQGGGQADIDSDGEVDPIEGVPTRSRADLGPQDNPQGDAYPPGEFSEEATLEGTTQDGEAGDEAPAALSEQGSGATPLNFPAPADGSAAPPTPSSGAPPARATTLTIFKASSNIFRGDRMSVEGQLTLSGGGPIADQPVEAFLVPVGRHTPDAFRLVGEGRTNQNGVVALEVSIPNDVALGRWSLYLYYRGDGKHSASHSQ